MVKIVTDSCADIPQAIAEALDIIVVPLSVRFGNIIFRDGVDLLSDAFYTRLASSAELPKTISPSPGDFTRVYESLGKDGDDIVSIHISQKLSGTYNSALVAARDVAPHIRVEVIDSLAGSMGEGIIALRAAQVAKQGGSLEEVKGMVFNTLPLTHFFGFVDTLEYLHKGGRLGRGSAFLGSLLQVKPLLQIKDGEIYPLERIRGHKKALMRMVELTRGYHDIEDLVVMHSTTPEDADWLADQVSSLVAPGHLYRACVGPTIGTYLGPGTITVGVVGRA